MDTLGGHIGVVIPIRSARLPITLPIQALRVSANLEAAANGLNIPDGMWGWAPQNITKRIIKFVLEKIKEKVDGWLPTLRAAAEDALNDDPNAALPDAPAPADAETMTAESLAADAVDSMGGWGVILDVGTSGGRGILRTVGDGIVDLGLMAGDAVGIDGAGDVLEDRREANRQQRIDALVEWVSQIGLNVRLTGNGGIGCDNQRTNTAVFTATAAATITGNGNLDNDIRLAAHLSMSNVTAFVGSAAIGVESVTLDTDATVGMNNSGEGVAMGNITGSMRGLTFDAPPSEGGGS
jgi:hypothetical protein